MIYCNLMGGLGNQLFQIFATISYSMYIDTTFTFPSNHLLFNKNNIRKTYWNTFLKNLQCYTIDDKPNYFLIREKCFEYNQLPYIQNSKNANLFGYFQSYKYFEYNYHNICNLIQLKKIKKIVSEVYPYNYSNTISIHFRIGDYKMYSEKYELLKYEYYRNSLSYIKENTNCREILYFCEKEDISEVEPIISLLKTDFPEFSFHKIDENIDDWKQLVIMSLCSHNIIANSTFSWWGAYFNSNRNKIVCYPEKWFCKNINYDLNDLFPYKWVKINSI